MCYSADTAVDISKALICKFYNCSIRPLLGYLNKSPFKKPYIQGWHFSLESAEAKLKDPLFDVFKAKLQKKLVMLRLFLYMAV